jgi:type II secretory ATPase GspE/PulE/Tfp pilus assembly ATPase PilB-like protein
VQVHPKIGFGIAEALRSFLRADPDVIMIGEMRDAETTKTAVAASLTGHLFFSTLHTNSAPETVGRLIEIGVDPYNFADALLGILAQRLARRLCDQCKVAYRPSREKYEELVAHYGEKWYRERPDRGDHLLLMENTGCPKCWQRLPGRIALHELLVGSPAVKRAIKKNASVEDLRDLAMQEGLRTLKMENLEGVSGSNRPATDPESLHFVTLTALSPQKSRSFVGDRLF